MELENWVSMFDIKKMLLDDYENFISIYKTRNIECYNRVFKDKDINKIELCFHTVSYVINYYY